MEERGTAAQAILRRGASSKETHAVVTVPPAAVIICSAEAENFCAVMSNFALTSPLPSTLTGWFLRTAPLATRSSTVTEPPSGKSSCRVDRFTTWNSTRKGLLKPRSLGSRMCSGICPPSKPNGTWLRALVPLVPRPAVLPLEASPRPTRVRAVLEPGAGRRSCSFSRESLWSMLLSFMSVHLFERHQVGDGADHAADLRAVFLHHRVTDALEAETPQRGTLSRVAADVGTDLGDLELHHAPTLSARASRSEEHTSELQPRGQLVCRLLLEQKQHETR